MEKASLLGAQAPEPEIPQPKRRIWRLKAACLLGLVCLVSFFPWPHWRHGHGHGHHHGHDHPHHGDEGHHGHGKSPYGEFPQKNDPFRFIPCTNTSLPPALEDAHASRSWAKLFDPNPKHWSWGNDTVSEHLVDHRRDPYDGRGIYLCGYLDVPMDYTNKSDARIVRVAVTKYQVSGLSRRDGHSKVSTGKKTERTLFIEPGGPGGSGTSMLWSTAEIATKRFTDSSFDVLGWDPRGVNTSLPSVSCFPHNADRDRWSLRSGQYREVSPSPRAQLEFADAMHGAIFNACKEKYGDFARFVSTAFVARDLEEIRKSLGEDDVSGWFVSYGTGIGQTYASMFPDSVGRLILDGTEYVRDHRLLGGFGWTSLDNVTSAWHDGFLGECINAGEAHCALAKPVDGKAVTLSGLQERVEGLVRSLIKRPIPAYTESGGPSLITYSNLVAVIYRALYKATTWPALAQALSELEDGNSTLAAIMIETAFWQYDPTQPSPPGARPESEELGLLVICADAYDAPLPANGLDWWESLWANMTEKSWISGNSRLYDVLPCQQFSKYWPDVAEAYRGDLNKTLKTPILLIGEVYDPATPLRNGRRLLNEMGKSARLIAHHGYGHSSRDTSNCTESIARAYIMEGKLPEEQETDCYANEKPYLYGLGLGGSGPAEPKSFAAVWKELAQELAIYNPRL